MADATESPTRAARSYDAGIDHLRRVREFLRPYRGQRDALLKVGPLDLHTLDTELEALDRALSEPAQAVYTLKARRAQALHDRQLAADATLTWVREARALLVLVARGSDGAARDTARTVTSLLKPFRQPRPLAGLALLREVVSRADTLRALGPDGVTLLTRAEICLTSLTTTNTAVEAVDADLEAARVRLQTASRAATDRLRLLGLQWGLLRTRVQPELPTLPKRHPAGRAQLRRAAQAV